MDPQWLTSKSLWKRMVSKRRFRSILTSKKTAIQSWPMEYWKNLRTLILALACIQSTSRWWRRGWAMLYRNIDWSSTSCVLSVSIAISYHSQPSSSSSSSQRHQVHFVIKWSKIAGMYFSPFPQVYTKERELHAKMALEETLIKARLLSDRDLIMSNLVNEGIFVEDLLYGAVTEVELKEFIPKIGPRKRLLRSLQTERERRRRSSTEIVIRNDGTTSPMMTTGNYSKTSCNFQKSTAQTPPPPLTRKNRMAAMSSPLSMPELSSGV